jgi:replicative DNA helicase
MSAIVNAEHSVLGAILIDHRVIDDVVEILEASDFFDCRHKAIYSGMVGMMGDGQNIDTITLAEKLQELGTLEDIGGLQYLTQVARNVPSARNAKQYANKVLEASVIRRLSAASADIGSLADNHAVPVGEKLERAQKLIQDLAEKRVTSGPKLVSEIIPQVVANLDKRISSGGEIVGQSTGFTDLDARTNGLKPSDLVIVAGRPSMGKTTLAMNIAESAAIDGKTVLVFSMEMSDESLMDRCIASLGRVKLKGMLNGKIEDEDWTKITRVTVELNKTKMLIDQTPALSVLELKARARKVKRQHGLDLIVVDYLQLMTGTGENRTNIVSDISRGLKALAKELDVPVVALSQLNRSLESRADRRPIMSDLRESGAIEQDADIIMFVYRDEVYDKKTENPGVAEIITAKQRNGETGTDYLTFNGSITRFDNFTGRYIEKEDKPKKQGYDG